MVTAAPLWALLLGACESGAQRARLPLQPPRVSVVTLKAQTIPLATELPGRTAAYRIAEVRPQVGGVVLKRLFEEGGEVRAGQPLYQIDPAPFRAARDSAAAALARAQASAALARSLAERYKPLFELQAVSRQDYENAVTAQGEADADVGAAKAALERARINLLYTKVLSPIAGRTGRSAVTEGALVTAEQTMPLVVVQQYDPIYVDVTQSSAALLRLRRELASGALKTADRAPVRLRLEDDSEYPHVGELQFSEAAVDPGTGSVTLRALFPNPERLLLPGMFVRERVEEGVRESVLLVAQRGVTRDEQGEATALLVNPDGMVEQRRILAERTVGDQWLVSAGLAVGDRVIVEGLQKIREGDRVEVAEEAGSASRQNLSVQPAAPTASKR